LREARYARSAFARNSRKERGAALGISKRFNRKQPDDCVCDYRFVQLKVSSHPVTQLKGETAMVKKTKTVSKTKIVKADPKSIGLQQTGKVYIKP
jgi:hypothetical protein